MHGRTDRRTDNMKTVYPLQTKFEGGIISAHLDLFSVTSEWPKLYAIGNAAMGVLHSLSLTMYIHVIE